jgi:hypothetical protein
MKLKTYIYAAIAVFFLALLAENRIQSVRIKKQKADIARIEENNLQLMADVNSQMVLNLTQKEVTGKLKAQRDSLAKAFKTRPKEITKIVETKIVVHDTVKVKVFVQSTGKDYWTIKDGDKCWKWEADAYLWDDSLNINRTLFEYSNKTTSVFYRKAPHIWFIRIGKWKNFENISSECGQSSVKTFNFSK